jgi:hypothetical protein
VLEDRLPEVASTQPELLAHHYTEANCPAQGAASNGRPYICVSARVREDAAGRLDLAFEDMGEQALKNIARPVRAYRVRTALTHPVANAPGSLQILAAWLTTSPAG